VAVFGSFVQFCSQILIWSSHFLQSLKLAFVEQLLCRNSVWQATDEGTIWRNFSTYVFGDVPPRKRRGGAARRPQLAVRYRFASVLWTAMRKLLPRGALASIAPGAEPNRNSLTVLRQPIRERNLLLITLGYSLFAYRHLRDKHLHLLSSFAH